MLLWFRCWDLEVAPMYVKKYVRMISFRQPKHLLIWSLQLSCQYISIMEVTKKKTIWLLWSSVVQHKNIGRGPCSCKASLVIRTDTSKSCYSYCPGLVASSVWKVPQYSSVLGPMYILESVIGMIYFHSGIKILLCSVIYKLWRLTTCGDSINQFEIFMKFVTEVF